MTDPDPTFQRVFVDTAGWYALVDQSDRDHRRAASWMNENESILVTTDYIFDETITLLRRKLSHPVAAQFGGKLLESNLARRINVRDEDRQNAWNMFVRYSDEPFSFTDCTSFQVMERLEINIAFTFDRDFRTAGFRTVPE